MAGDDDDVNRRFGLKHVAHAAILKSIMVGRWSVVFVPEGETGPPTRCEPGKHWLPQGSLNSLQVTYYLLLIRWFPTKQSDLDPTWKLGLRVHSTRLQAGSAE